jgi:competence protein ComEA
MKLLIALLAAAMLASASCSPTANKAGAGDASEQASQKSCINLNTATERELITLDGIGEATARKIVEYREQNGPFRRAQEIIIIDGFSERKYRAISDRVCV